MRERCSVALARTGGCSSLRRCVIAVALLCDSFVMRSSGWLAARRNLGCVDGSPRCDDFGLSRLCEPSGIPLAGSRKVSIRYHGHRVLVRLPRKTPCHSPVKKCLNPNATATLSIHSTRCIWMSRVRTYGLGAAQRAGYSENWLGPSAAHLAIPDGMDF